MFYTASLVSNITESQDSWTSVPTVRLTCLAPSGQQPLRVFHLLNEALLLEDTQVPLLKHPCFTKPWQVLRASPPLPRFPPQRTLSCSGLPAAPGIPVFESNSQTTCPCSTTELQSALEESATYPLGQKPGFPLQSPVQTEAPTGPSRAGSLRLQARPPSSPPGPLSFPGPKLPPGPSHSPPHPATRRFMPEDSGRPAFGSATTPTPTPAREARVRVGRRRAPAQAPETPCLRRPRGFRRLPSLPPLFRRAVHEYA